jgi:hypothetical protein
MLLQYSYPIIFEVWANDLELLACVGHMKILFGDELSFVLVLLYWPTHHRRTQAPPLS